MKWSNLSRRFVLQGIGAALALPALPSLGQTASTQKTFVGIAAQNGLFRMYGPESQLMPKLPFDPAGFAARGVTRATTSRHDIHTASLATLAQNNGGRISDIIDQSFTPYLGKMLMLQGLDYLSSEWCHHHAQFGSTGLSTQDGVNNPHMPSMEQVMARAASFYKNPALKGRAVAWTTSYTETRGYGTSWVYQDPSNPTTSGLAFNPAAVYSPASVWDAYFGTSTQSTPLRKTVVDQVLADYRSLRQSNRRLGAADRQRLDLHVQLLQDTQQKVNATVAVCNEPRPASSNATLKIRLTTMNDVITALAACGMCHSFIGWTHALLSTDPEQWHRWAHAAFDSENDRAADAAAYTSNVEQNRSIMKDMALDLVQKFSAQGLLDNSLIAVVQEHGRKGHDSWNVPVITFGSAGGVLKTGQYIDYRNMATGDDLVRHRFGYPMNQLHANFLMAVGVPREEFEPHNRGGGTHFKPGSGYGQSRYGYANSVYSGPYASWAGHDLSAWLPQIKA